VEKLGAKSIVIIDDRTAYGQVIADEFERGVRDAGGRIAYRDFTTDRATEFGDMLARIQPRNPDLVFYGGMDTVAAPLLKQMKALGISAKLMGGDGICATEMPKLAGGLTEQQVICAEAGGVSAPQDVAKLQAFNQRFKAEFGQEPIVYAPYVYDAVMVLASAMVRARSTDPRVYLDALRDGGVHMGVTGPIMFDEKGDILRGPITFYTYVNGKRTEIAVIR
jgi:branched-chain amino acid transport system substrate-binding protein